MNEKRITEDWGAYEPEVQKALRFVALHDQGAAKQIADAIAKEYAKREQAKSTKRTQTLTENDLTVLRIASSSHNLDVDKAIEWSRLSEDQFFQSIETLKRQKYLRGDIFFGYARTKKLVPSEEDIKFDQRCKRLLQEKVPGWKL